MSGLRSIGRSHSTLQGMYQGQDYRFSHHRPRSAPFMGERNYGDVFGGRNSSLTPTFTGVRLGVSANDRVMAQSERSDTSSQFSLFVGAQISALRFQTRLRASQPPGAVKTRRICWMEGIVWYRAVIEMPVLHQI